MIRLLLYGFIIYVVYRVVKSWAKSVTGPDRNVDSVARSDNTELIRDPQCGTYFLRQQGVDARVDGQTLFFCSEQCRDAFLREHKLS
jgi:YHS domain-containing protein